MEKRKAINFYRSYYEVAIKLPKKYRWPFVEAVLRYQFEGVEPSDTTGFELAWISQKHSLDKQLQGFIHGKKGGAPPKGKSNPPSKGTSNQEQVQEKGQVQVQISIENRKAEFKNSLLSEFINQYDENMLLDFFEYWTEHSPKARKMRYEKEKAFDVTRRLKTWARNQKKFGGVNNGFGEIADY